MTDLATRLEYEEDNLSSGHYLDRAITLAQVFGLTDSEWLLRANKIFLEKNSKPAGLDALILSVSLSAIYLAKRRKLTKKQLKPLAWAVPYEALKVCNLTKLRD